MTMTEDIASFVASFSLKAAPGELLPKVRETFLDSFGVMLAGSREESAQLAARWVQRQGAAGACSVIAQKRVSHFGSERRAGQRGRGAHPRLRPFRSPERGDGALRTSRR